MAEQVFEHEKASVKVSDKYYCSFLLMSITVVSLIFIKLEF